MLLLIDAGNTRVKWALVDPATAPQLGVWLHFGSFRHEELDQARSQWALHPIRKVIVSNVAGSGLQSALALAVPQDSTVHWFVAQPELAGIINRYREPGRLGSDRFASAIAAHALYPGQNLIVATCGTATTIDMISAQGDFIGGMIAPGLLLMTQSLALNTAQLPQLTDPQPMAAHFAQRTEAAILSGCLTAQVGAIEYAVRHFVDLTGSDVEAATGLPLCILSGGAAQFLQPSLRIPHQLIDNLVLIGLQAYSLC